MKKLLISLAIIFTFITPVQKAHALNPKTKAFLVMCAYGTVGGSLLGFASMAFGTNSRAIAQGASLGLYAGIIFGGYVISSHRDPNAPVDEYSNDPYYGQPAGDPGYPPADNSGGGYGYPPANDGSSSDDSSSGGFFGTSNRVMEINQDYMNSVRSFSKKRGNMYVPRIYLNLYHATF